MRFGEKKSEEGEKEVRDGGAVDFIHHLANKVITRNSFISNDIMLMTELLLFHLCSQIRPALKYPFSILLRYFHFIPDKLPVYREYLMRSFLSIAIYVCVHVARVERSFSFLASPRVGRFHAQLLLTLLTSLTRLRKLDTRTNLSADIFSPPC